MNTKPCDHQIVDAFLLQIHDPIADETELQNHLDTCPHCRSYYVEKVASKNFWDEASSLLKTSAYDHASRVEFSAGSLGKTPIGSQQIRDVLSRLAPSDDPYRLGRIGCYEVTGVIGMGAMGIVLKAFDQSLDRVVAVKVLASHLANSGTARERFAREAKAVAAILHPNVIPIHGVSEDSELPFFVMSYVHGESLQKRINDHGPLQVPEILRIGHQIAAGLSAAHEKGLVHRDIKPANILLEGETERVTITDFGLARAVDDVSLTRAGVIAGTPQYMSPEQSNGESIDQRSDLFSLGCVLYTLCTGRTPFRAQTPYGLVREINESEPTPIRELNPSIPAWMSNLISKLLAKDKANRFQNANQVCQLLEKCLRHREQPTTVSLPSELSEHQPSFFLQTRTWTIGAVLMTSLVCLGLFFLPGFFGNRSPSPELNKGDQPPAIQQLTKKPIIVTQGTSAKNDDLAAIIAKMDGKSGSALICEEAIQVLYSEAACRYAMVYEDRVRVNDPTLDTRPVRNFTIEGLKGADVTQISMCPKGRFLAYSTKKKAVLWDVEERKQLMILHRGQAELLQFSPSGRYLVAGMGKTVRVLTLPQPGRPGGWGHRLKGHQGPIVLARFSRDESRLLTGAEDRTVIIWKTAQMGPIAHQWKHPGILHTVRFSPDEKFILTSCENRESGKHPVNVWDANTGKLKLSIEHVSPAKASFTDDGKQVVSVSQDTISWWNAYDGSEMNSFALQGVNHLDARFAIDGRHLALRFKKQWILWDLLDPVPVKKLVTMAHELKTNGVHNAEDEKAMRDNVNDAPKDGWFSFDKRPGYYEFYSLSNNGVFDFWTVPNRRFKKDQNSPFPPVGDNDLVQKKRLPADSEEPASKGLQDHQQPEQDSVKVYLLELKPIKGLTVDKGEPLGDGVKPDVWRHIKPIADLRPSDFTSVKALSFNGPTSKYYRVRVELTVKAKKQLKSKIEKMVGKEKEQVWLRSIYMNHDHGSASKYVLRPGQFTSLSTHHATFAIALGARSETEADKIVEALKPEQQNNQPAAALVGKLVRHPKADTAVSFSGGNYHLITENGKKHLLAPSKSVPQSEFDSAHLKLVRLTGRFEKGATWDGSEGTAGTSLKPKGKHQLPALFKVEKLEAIENEHASPIHHLKWSADGKRLVSVSDDGVVCFWNRQLTKIARTQIEPTLAPMIAFTPNLERMAVVNYKDDIPLIKRQGGGKAVVYSLPEGKTIHRLDVRAERDWNSPANSQIYSFLFSPDGKRLVAGGSSETTGYFGKGALSFWDVDAGQNIRRSLESNSRINAMSWSSDGKLLAIGTNGRDGGGAIAGEILLQHTTETGKRTIHPKFRKPWSIGTPEYASIFRVEQLRISEGKLTALLWQSKQDTVTTWDIETGESRSVSMPKKNPNLRYQLSSSGNKLATWDGKTVSIYEARSLEKIATDKQANMISAVAFSPDDTIVAIATKAGKIQIQKVGGSRTGELKE